MKCRVCSALVEEGDKHFPECSGLCRRAFRGRRSRAEQDLIDRAAAEIIAEQTAGFQSLQDALDQWEAAR